MGIAGTIVRSEIRRVHEAAQQNGRHAAPEEDANGTAPAAADCST